MSEGDNYLSIEIAHLLGMFSLQMVLQIKVGLMGA